MPTNKPLQDNGNDLHFGIKIVQASEQQFGPSRTPVPTMSILSLLKMAKNAWLLVFAFQPNCHSVATTCLVCVHHPSVGTAGSSLFAKEPLFIDK